MIGTTVSHYRIVSHIGSGGMGTVYLADDLNLHRKVALKFLAAREPRAARTRQPACCGRPGRRARSIIRNIATIYEIGDAGGQPFIAMAYYEGETLAARLARGPLPVAEVARILSPDRRGAGRGARRRHRASRPQAIQPDAHLGRAGEVLTSESPRSKPGETATQLTQRRQHGRHAAYMSPEQARARSPTRAPISGRWASSPTRCSTGRPPFDGDQRAGGDSRCAHGHSAAHRRRAGPTSRRELAAIVERTLVRDRAARAIAAVRDRSSWRAAAMRGWCQAISRSFGRRADPASASPPPSSPSRSSPEPLGGWCDGMPTSAGRANRPCPSCPARRQLTSSSAAFDLAQRARQYIPNDPLLAEQLRMVSRP